MTEQTTPLFSTIYDKIRYVGTVVHVTAATVELALPDARQLAEHRRNGAPENGGEVGTFVVIQAGHVGIFGQITDVRMPAGADTIIESESDRGGVRPVASVELLTTIETDHGAISQGVAQHPRIGQHAFAADPALVQFIIESRQLYEEQEGGLRLEYAELPHSPGTTISFTPERMFGRHCAILGSSGGGKSWSTARLIEQCARFRSKVILLDATGEYYPLSRGVRHVYLGYDPKPRDGAVEVSLPYYQLTENDLFAIFRPSGQSQAPKLRAAMKSLKLARLAPSLAPNGTILKANKQKQQYRAELQKHYAAVESSYANFDIRLLTRQIHNECVNPNRSPTEPMFWGGPNSIDQSHCVPMINRIADIIKSPNLAPIFNPGDNRSLIDELELFLREDESRVLRISLQYLSFAHSAREIIANAIGRQLLGYGREERFKKAPLLIVVDEAHQFLNREVTDETAAYALDSFALIAKEGRKYALNICIATQRPRDVPEGVLSQVGTFIVHRLINDSDRRVVERASGELDKSSAQSLPTLAPGEAVLIGVDFPIPMAIKVLPPERAPDSSGPDFQRYWS